MHHPFGKRLRSLAVITLCMVCCSPFSGPLALGENNTDAHTLSLLADELSTTVNATVTNSTNTPLDHPGNVQEYQLYPGGPVYAVPRIAATLSNQTIEPDPVNNPLGVYRDNGQDSSIYADTKFQGAAKKWRREKANQHAHG